MQFIYFLTKLCVDFSFFSPQNFDYLIEKLLRASANLAMAVWINEMNSHLVNTFFPQQK